MHSRARGTGDAVLLIHGMPTNGRLWDGVVRELESRFKCVVIDLPGMGATPFQGYGPKYLTQVAAQIEQVRQRHHLRRCHLVGHDGGCAIALQYAHMFPENVACLALLSPAFFPDLQPYFLLEMLRKPILGEVFAPLVSSVFWHIVMRRAVAGVHNAEQRASFRRQFSSISGAWKLMRLVRWGNPETVFATIPSMLQELTAPTLVIHGERDVLPDSFARRAAGLIQHSQLIAVDSGHFIPMECAIEVSHSLAAFFECRGRAAVTSDFMAKWRSSKRADATREHGGLSLSPQPAAQ